MSIACNRKVLIKADEVCGVKVKKGEEDYSWTQKASRREKLVLLSFNTMALPRGFEDYLCLELHIVHQVRITFKNPEKSSLFG